MFSRLAAAGFMTTQSGIPGPITGDPTIRFYEPDLLLFVSRVPAEGSNFTKLSSLVSTVTDIC